MTADATKPWEFVFVRHHLASKRGDFDRVRPMISPPFESTSSSSSTGIDALTGFTRPSNRWMIATHFPKFGWIPLYSNVATARQMFEANKHSRRMETLWLRRHPHQTQLFFHLVSARASVIQFTFDEHSGENEWKRTCQCRISELDEPLRACESALDAFDLLCQHFSVSLNVPWITEASGRFQVIGVSGNPIKTGMGQYVVYSAPGLAAGENQASERLAEGIERGKPKLVQTAIQDGARLDVLPETSLTPLVTAMFRCGKKRKWRECAQAIVDAGYPIDGDERQGAPIFNACEHFVPEPMTIKMLEFLIANQADINRQRSSGLTVLDTSACYRREKIVEWLLDHGADPNLPTRGDKSIIDEIGSRVEKDLKYRPTSKYEGVLKLLEAGGS